MKKHDVVTFGSSVVDVFVETGLSEIHRMLCYPSGAKIKIKKAGFSTGGGGTNTAVSFSKLGLETGCITKVGRDANAELVLGELKKYKVDFLGKRGKGNTGFSVILDSKEHNRTILTDKGESDNLSFSEISKKALNTEWFYFSSTAGKSFKAQEKLAKLGKKKKIKIAFNPSLYQAKLGIGKLKGLLGCVDVLILNKEEARELGGLEKLHKLGIKIICITDGKNGNLVSDGIFLWKSGTHKNIKVKERTGAGDAFASAFVFGLIKNLGLEKAIQAGVANAESVIQIKGAKNGLLSLNGLNKKLKKPVKITKKK
jgi:ribokinase